MRVVTLRMAARKVRGDRTRHERERRVARPNRSPSFLETVERRSLRRFLVGHVDRLPVPYREVLRMRYVEGREIDEVARALGRPAATVRSQIQRGLVRLRVQINGSLAEERHLWGFGLIAAILGRWLPRPTAAVPGAGTVLLAGLGVVLVGLIAGVSFRGDGQRPPLQLAAHTSIAPPTEPDVAAPTPSEALARRAVEVAIVELPKGSLRVVARDARDDLPVAGLELLAESLDLPWSMQEAQRATTDADGAALFTSLDPAVWRIRPQRGDPAQVEVRAGDVAETRVLVPRGLDVRGTVRDGAGRAVPGATIRVSWPERAETTEVAGRADAEGRFQLAAIDPRAWIHAERAGRLPSASTFLGWLPRHDGSIDADLVVGREPEQPLSLSVVDHAGAPVPHATVEALTDAPEADVLGSSGSLERRPRRRSLGTTDVRGRLAVFADEASEILVLAAGRPAWRGVPESNGSGTLRAVLPRPASLEGRVASPDGSPASRTRVVLETQAPLPPLPTRTGEDGSFRLENLPPGGCTLRAFGEGGSSAVQEVLVEEGSTSHVALRLSDEWTIRGVARDEFDIPLPGWTVTLESHQGRALRLLQPGVGEAPSLPRCMADEEGRFTFAGLDPVSYDLRLTPPGEDAVVPHAWIDDVRPGESDVRLQCTPDGFPSASVRGRIAGLDAQRLASLRLMLQAPRLERPVPLALGAAGDFEAGPLPPGSYDLLAQSPELGAWKIDDFYLLPDDRRELRPIRCPLPGALRIRLRAAADLVGSRASLLLFSEESALRRSPRIDELEEESIEVDTLPPGEYRLALRVAGFGDVFERVTVAAGQRTILDVDLEAGFRQDFCIVPPRSWDPGIRRRFRLHGPRGSRPLVIPPPTADDLERVRFSLSLAPGDYRLQTFFGPHHFGELSFSVSDSLDPSEKDCLTIEL